LLKGRARRGDRQARKTRSASSSRPNRPRHRLLLDRLPTIDLEVGESLTLVSQPDGIRYGIQVFGRSYDASAYGSTSG